MQKAIAEALWALNETSGFGHNFDGLRASEAQASVVERVRAATVRDAPSAPPPGAEEALRELLGSRAASYTDEADLSAVAPFCLAEVSWPRSAGAVALAPLLPEADWLLLSEGGERLQLSAEEWQGRVEVEGLLRPYWDETSRRERNTYLAFVRELLVRRMVSLRPARRHAAGIFVRKKSGRLRMVVDARVTNQALRRPPATRLASTLAVAALAPAHAVEA